MASPNPKRSAPDVSITSLTDDALVEILSRVGASSVADLTSAKRSCKDLLRASGDNLIFQRLSMRKLPFVPWRERDVEFHDRCLSAGNAEALYREGMVNYFSGEPAERELGRVKEAAEMGHAEARYVYGMAVLVRASDRQGKEEGKEILTGLVRDCEGAGDRVSRIRDCRRNALNNLRTMWVRNEEIVRRGEEIEDCEWRVDRGWETEQEIDGWTGCCGSCSWECEAKKFCSMIRVTK